jgi:hypothetical protein
MRQVNAEGWTAEHDDAHGSGSLATAAAAYCESANRYMSDGSFFDREFVLDELWPVAWDEKWFKPKTPIRDLVRAGALIAAEIDGRLRAGEK